MATAGSLEALRELNRLRVIDALRQRGTASRSDIARHTGLSRTTVTTLVSDLQAKGPRRRAAARRDPGARQAADPPAPRPLRRGRGRDPLRPPPRPGGRRRPVVHRARRAHAGSRRRPRGRRPRSTRPPASSPSCSRKPGSSAPASSAPASGLSGPVDRDGTVGSTVILPGWAGLNAVDELTERLDLQVSVDNDANLGALAEVSFGAGRGMSDVIYVMVSSGVGAGIVLDGKLHRGVTGARRRARARQRPRGRRRLPLREPRLPRDRGIDRCRPVPSAPAHGAGLTFAGSSSCSTRATREPSGW